MRNRRRDLRTHKPIDNGIPDSFPGLRRFRHMKPPCTGIAYTAENVPVLCAHTTELSQGCLCHRLEMIAYHLLMKLFDKHRNLLIYYSAFFHVRLLCFDSIISVQIEQRNNSGFPRKTKDLAPRVHTLFPLLLRAHLRLGKKKAVRASAARTASGSVLFSVNPQSPNRLT